MIDALAEPLRDGIVQRALLEVLILGAVCGPLGAWAILFRQSYAAESTAHAMLPGLVLAALAGLPLLLGAAGGVLVAAAATTLAARDERIGPDTAVGVTVTVLFGAGALLALLPDAPARLEELLFGDLLGVGAGDLIASGAVAAVVLLVLAAMHRDLVLSGFDPAAARSLAAAPARTELVLLVLLGVSVAVAVQALGNLLVVALVIAPAAAAHRIARRLVAVLALSALLAALSGVLGLYASYHLEVAAGASVALAALLLFALTLPLSAAGLARR